MSYSYLSILHWHQPVFLHSCLTGKWAYYKLALAYKVVTLANHDNREYIPTTRCGFISVVSMFTVTLLLALSFSTLLVTTGAR